MADRLRLYIPVKPTRINQKWGENSPCVKDFGLPTQHIISGMDDFTCPIGYEKLYPKFGMRGHNGIDYATGEQEVRAACDGIVIEKQTVPARGLGLGIITHEKVNLDEHGEHYAKLRYWHLKTMYVDVGDEVRAGDLIGISDNTGFSSGNHLHFELQPMQRDAGGHPYLSNPSGHITGTIDPLPFMSKIHAADVQEAIALNQRLVIFLTKIIDLLKNK